LFRYSDNRPHPDLVTSVDYPRIRVDVAQTGFFSGHTFRAFRRLNLTAGTTLVVKVVAPIDIILYGFSVDIISGHFDLETRVGGTEGGTFDGGVTVIPANTMSTASGYVHQVITSDGGTHTGGTVIDVLMAKTDTTGQKSFSVGAGTQDERGIGAGTYYFVIDAIGLDNLVGVFNARWEERPTP
jgi:hypothetical protein